jgi:2-amino-4-hydroxy-6-hydroxymethyldihydropteridine diphosphokinase
VPQAVFALGSNLGDRLANLCTGAAVLGEWFGPVVGSAVYESPPAAGSSGNFFLNAVCVTTVPGPLTALAAARAAERRAGRVRSARWAPRSLDVDVVAVDGLVAETAALTLPHPRAHLRAFVLRPWLDVDPDAELPGRGPVAGILSRLDEPDVERRYDELSLATGPGTARPEHEPG